ncbi:hypothetical protein Sste5346_001081 [Sporothrix stenoceras]|uniref:Molybdenum cofactor sulfurase middle domain-containing protein n=1 Tax=Sporothrix stenoceras TaxID=5173 RepID=A0ABR3ZR21_9PEZI
MDAADSRLLMGPEPSVLVSVFQALADPGSLTVLLITLFGFVLPMVWIYPPVAPRPSDFLNETHSKLGFEDAKTDERAARLASATKKDDTGAPRIDSLWVYPVKSCPGIQISRSRVLATGVEFDRLFAFTQLSSPFPARAGTEIVKKAAKTDDDDDDTWDAINRRQFPMLSTLQVELWRPDLAKVRHAQARMRADDRAERTASMSELYVVVRYPWQAIGWAGRWDWFAAKLARGWRAVPEEEVVLPLSLPDVKDKKVTVKYGHVRIDDAKIRALDLSAELPRSLQLYLGVSNKLGLFRYEADRKVRLLNRSSIPPAKTSAEDDDELLVSNGPRANIIVDGIDEYDEQSWKHISFKPSSASNSLLDEAVFDVDTSKSEKRKTNKGASSDDTPDIYLAPMFEHFDKPELMEQTLETGMSVQVLQ